MSPALGAKHVLPHLASTRKSVYVALPLVRSETSLSLLSPRDQVQVLSFHLGHSSACEALPTYVALVAT